MRFKIKILLILFSGSVLFTAKNSFGQYVRVADRVIVAGYVLESESLEPIPYVNIYVKQTRRGTITNSKGHFILSARINDTLVFSSMGYKTQFAVIDDGFTDKNESLIMLLEKRYYQIGSVDIISLRRYEQLKYEVVNMQLPDDEFVYAVKNFPSRPVDIDYHSRAGASDFGLIFSPITALYDAFSREGRERRKLQELLERDREQALIESKISIQKISRITGLDLYEAEDFFKWCNFPTEFILRLSDYELILLIMHRFEQYQRIKGGR